MKKEKIPDGSYVLLIGQSNEESSDDVHILLRKEGIYTNKFGTLDTRKLKSYGQKIRLSGSDKLELTVVKPTAIDFLHKARRMPQVVLPKDASIIAAVTGLAPGWHCLDAGAGSGFLAIFLGNLVQPSGSVVSYELNKEHAKTAEHNVKICGLKNITVKNKSAFSFNERGLDLITLDMKDAERLVPRCYKALKPGAWLCVYSPHIEQVKSVVDAIRNAGKRKGLGKGFIDVQTLEVIKRQWKVDTHTHPVPSGIMHTGFMTFGRKI